MKTNKLIACLSVLFALILLSGVYSTSAQICTPVPQGLVSAYSGDGNALDARSRNNGTVQGNVIYAAGHTGQGFQLGGTGDTSGNGDRVVVGNPSGLQLQEFTIEAWIKRSSTAVVTNSPAPGTPAAVIFSYGQNGYGLLIDQQTNALGLTQVGVNQVNSTLIITDTNWHHVAVSKTSANLTFYLDGVADTTIAYTSIFTFTTPAAIGARGDSNVTNAFFGAIDELAIYDHALSPGELQSIFNSGTAGKCKPLATNAPDGQVLWMAGDGDAKDIASGNTAVLQNGASYQLGKVGQSFKFDGVDDQITLAHNAAQNNGTDLTIEAWINPSSLPHGGTILQKRTAGNIGGYLLELTQPSGSGSPNGIQFVIMIGGAYHTLNPANVITPNTWQHVAATYDGAAMRIYVNGVEVANLPQTGAIDAVPEPIVIGRNVVNGNAFPGMLDELSVYKRALSADEIRSIVNADLAGKYKIQSTVPTGVAAWYAGEGSVSDLQGANTGTLNGGATYAQGKVGQAFSLNGINASVQAPGTAANDPTGAANGASMEAWIYLTQRPSDAGRQMYILSKTGTGSTDGFDIHIDPDNLFKFVWANSYTGFASVPVQTGVWYHVAATFSPATVGPTAGVRLYVNGQFQGLGNVFAARTPSGVPLEIGNSTPLGSNRYFSGLIDEPTEYNRTLTQAEVRNIFNAGPSGKYKGANNPAVSNKATAGEAEVTFGSVTEGGAVSLTPLNKALFPALPMGGVIYNTYDVSSSAMASNPTVCFNVPSFPAPQFSRLRIYHLESGVWQNRTAGVNTYPTICSAGVTSLSPFAIGLLDPTAASASIGGRVMAGKTGIANATVTISGGSLSQPQSARTNAFGYYKFDQLPVGETYVITVSAKRYTFSQSSQIVNFEDETTGVDFAADDPVNAVGVRNTGIK